MHHPPPSPIQTHDPGDAARVYLLAIELKLDRRAETFCEIREHSRRPRMETGWIRNHDRVRGDARAAICAVRSYRRSERYRVEHIFSRNDCSASPFPMRHTLAVRDHDLREQALRVRGEKI